MLYLKFAAGSADNIILGNGQHLAKTEPKAERKFSGHGVSYAYTVGTVVVCPFRTAPLFPSSINVLLAVYPLCHKSIRQSHCSHDIVLPWFSMSRTEINVISVSNIFTVLFSPVIFIYTLFPIRQPYTRNHTITAQKIREKTHNETHKTRQVLPTREAGRGT